MRNGHVVFDATCKVEPALQPLKIRSDIGSVLIAWIAVLLKAFEDDALQCLRHSAVEASRRCRRLMEDCVEYFGVSLTREGTNSRSHFIQHSPEGEQVASHIQTVVPAPAPGDI